ncbi:MAG: GNAT family N-acetyltransferase [Anaerolineae bacterium]|nr:GNAT family N-acetyltransferase [Anaerolineae bacterium]
MSITLSPFTPADQPTVKALVLAGLADHWGTLDLSKNPDLNDIAATYKDAYFIVAKQQGEVVGCGALVPRSTDTAEVVRMSVAAAARRQGLGRRILTALCAEAKARGFKRIILETTQTWSEVIAFYQRFGFRITHYKDGDVYFELLLDKWTE